MTGFSRAASMRCSALVAALLLVVGCGDDGVDAGPVITEGPTITANPNPAVPLAAIVELTTDVPTTLRLTVSDGQESFDIDIDAAATEHTVPVLGMWAGASFTIDVVAIADGIETAADASLAFTTDALPSDFPPIEVLVSEPGMMQAGVTLFDVFQWTSAGPNDDLGLLVAVDERGRVVWFYKTAGLRVTDARRLANGNLLFGIDPSGAMEIDMLGNRQREWFASALGGTTPSGAITVDTDTFHHEIFEMPSGNFLALSTEMQSLSAYPSSESDDQAAPADADVVGDVVVEFDPEDGSVVNRWSLFDLIDPYRIGYGSLTGFWNATYAASAPTGSSMDWTHANAVIYDPSDDAILVSVRHQDAVVKFSRATGDLIWILGPHENWASGYTGKLLEPQAGTEFQYHEHAPMITSSGNILMFDNGNGRASAFETLTAAPDNYSRAVEFSVNESAMTVQQEWAYGGGEVGDEQFYSPFIGDADELANGNVLVTDGGRVFDDAGLPSDAIGPGHKQARIVEVTRADPPVKVFEMWLRDTSPTDPLGWSVYRSEKLPSLYP